MSDDTITINGNTYQKVPAKDPGTWGKDDKKTTTTLAVHVVLDRSGSMQSVKDDTIGAFNSYVETLAKETPNATLSLTLFDSQGIDTIYSDIPINSVTKLDGTTYQPRASTPLYDAIGKCATILTGTTADRKALVIITDGYENASREWNQNTVKALLTEKQDKDGWLVIYLGANQDAWAVGASFGTRQGTTMSFDQKSTRSTLASTARATAAYGMAANAVSGQSVASFTDDERASALDGDDKK